MKQDFFGLGGSGGSGDDRQQQPPQENVARVVVHHMNPSENTNDVVLTIGTQTLRVKFSCPHLETHVKPLPENPLNVTQPCSGCQSTQENWVCLDCYEVRCSRFMDGHMLDHHQSTGHCLTMSYTDVTVWCYECDAYIFNNAVKPHRNLVHNMLFGTDIGLTLLPDRRTLI